MASAVWILAPVGVSALIGAVCFMIYYTYSPYVSQEKNACYSYRPYVYLGHGKEAPSRDSRLLRKDGKEGRRVGRSCAGGQHDEGTAQRSIAESCAGALGEKEETGMNPGTGYAPVVPAILG